MARTKAPDHETQREQILELAAAKLPIKTRFVQRIAE